MVLLFYCFIVYQCSQRTSSRCSTRTSSGCSTRTSSMCLFAKNVVVMPAGGATGAPALAAGLSCVANTHENVLYEHPEDSLRNVYIYKRYKYI